MTFCYNHALAFPSRRLQLSTHADQITFKFSLMAQSISLGILGYLSAAFNNLSNNLMFVCVTIALMNVLFFSLSFSFFLLLHCV